MKFAHWKSEPALKVWHLASLLHDVDPDELGDIVINEAGDGLDISHMINVLLEGLEVGELTAMSSGTAAPFTSQTFLTKPSVLAWLRAKEYFELADQLDSSEPTVLKAAVLVEKYRSSWPQIEKDLKQQATNGLGAARITHGMYDEREVVRWATKNGRLPSGAGSRRSPIPSTWWPKARP